MRIENDRPHKADSSAVASGSPLRRATAEAEPMPNPRVLGLQTSDDLWLGYGCEISDGSDGGMVVLDTMNPDHFGRPYLPANGQPLEWFATTDKQSTADIGEFYPFHGGAMISPRMRDVIEQVQDGGVEYIPLKILQRRSKALLDEWWFVNVFNWRRLFDLDRSELEWTSFDDPVRGWAKFERRFGEKRIGAITRLSLLPDVVATGGLFLVEAPTEVILTRVFVSDDLADALNARLSPDKQIVFDEFALSGRAEMPAFQL